MLLVAVRKRKSRAEAGEAEETAAAGSDHKEDEPFLNKPLKHYNEIVIIHGNTMATCQYTKGSNDPLATEVNEISDNEASPLEYSRK
ncbi:hypothetical protein ZWY2020_020170 [Hordeum vulgare]|nr:hypothetical protein ZWY2020_020170 [Hordeum vulgare]